MVLQELDQYPLSSRDLEVSDKQIEVLDLSANAAADIGRYLFSDDVGPYKAPAYEKLMINTMNMMNYLARGDLNGARVEARRLAVMQKFTRDKGDAAEVAARPGQLPGRLRVREERQAGRRPALLRRSARPTASTSRWPSRSDGSRNRRGYSSPRIRELLAQGACRRPAARRRPARTTRELLVIVNFGRVPAKIAKRMPIGLALTYASGFISPGPARASQ